MENQAKKELIAQYKEKQRKKTGGVYAIRNTQNGKRLLLSAADLQGAKNRFDFAKNTDLCPLVQLSGDWKALGGAAFEFEPLETLEKKADQTDREFQDDMKTLEDLWREKLGGDPLY